MGFDIASLLSFDPPLGRCPKCLALLTADTWPQRVSTRFDCPVCRLGFVPSAITVGSYGATGFYPRSDLFGTSFAYTSPSPFLPLNLPEPLLEHAKRLATLASQLQGPDYEIAPIRLLVHLLISARSFIHVMSTGLSQEMVGVMRTVGELVSVAGIFSSIDKNTANDLVELEKDGVPLRALVAGTKSTNDDLPHTKLIVVDGLVAIAGSVNFTARAWRKAANRMEHVDVVTEIPRIVELNNNYFAHHWARLNTAFNATASGIWRYELPTPDSRTESIAAPGAADA